jgi:hypothetical protein
MKEFPIAFSTTCLAQERFAALKLRINCTGILLMQSETNPIEIDGSEPCAAGGKR